MFQDYPLLRHRTVLENLVVAGLASGMKPAAARVRARALLERFGLLDRAARYPAQLSEGAPALRRAIQRARSLRDRRGHPTARRGREHVGDDHAHHIVTHDIFAAMVVSDTILLLGRHQGQAGASIVETYDLVERGLAWREQVNEDPAFIALEQQIRARFSTL